MEGGRRNLAVRMADCSIKIGEVLPKVEFSSEMENFGVWKYVVKTVLRAYGLYGFVNGTSQCPTHRADSDLDSDGRRRRGKKRKRSDSDSDSESDSEGDMERLIRRVKSWNQKIAADKSEIRCWKQQDQAVKAFLNSTLACFVHCRTSRELWLGLEERSLRLSETYAPFFLETLENMHLQDGDSIEYYMGRLILLRDALASYRHVVSEAELIRHCLKGLTDDYQRLQEQLQAWPQENPPLRWEEVMVLLQRRESELPQRVKHSEMYC